MRTVCYNDTEIAASKIACVGRNYVEHILELKNVVPAEMVVFCKPNSAITHTLSARHGERLHYEAEICFLVQDGSLAAAGVGLDLTKRDLQTHLKEHGLPWERAKAFDGSALFSPFVALSDPECHLELELYVDRQLRQAGSTAMMIYQPLHILSELKRFMHLENGDIIMTGTPAGVGPVREGELFEAILKCADSTITCGSWRAY